MSNAERQVDLDAVRAKYRQERDKRVRVDGNEQYQEVDGDFAYFVDDPYVDAAPERAAQQRDVEVVVIGGGFGGMLSAVRLQQAGIDDIAIIEKGGGFGGTWYWNRYHGASCDIESYIYFSADGRNRLCACPQIHQCLGDAGLLSGDCRPI